ncbi:MAG: hypothetical protein AB7F99_20675, partial [Vicinamibacterales bacterium]
MRIARACMAVMRVAMARLTRGLFAVASGPSSAGSVAGVAAAEERPNATPSSADAERPGERDGTEDDGLVKRGVDIYNFEHGITSPRRIRIGPFVISVL